MDGLQQLLDLGLAEPGHRRERAHAAGVRAGVAVAEPLEVLRGRERRPRRVAVAEREQRDLLALEQLLDHERRRRTRPPARRPASSSVLRPADEDALAGREPVGLDHARRPRDGERCARSARRPPRITSLANVFEPSMPRRRRARPEDGDPAAPELVADAGDERRLGPDHDEVDVERAGEREQALAVVRAHRMALPERGDARVAGRGVQLVELGARGRASTRARARALPSRRAAPSRRRTVLPASAPPFASPGTRLPGLLPKASVDGRRACL